jgi:putative addiction module killer protein
MIVVRQTDEFRVWLAGLRDQQAAGLIARRIFRLQAGNFGDVKYFSGIGELRIDQGPGYRVYFAQRGGVLVVLLCGGTKQRQARDIAWAVAKAGEAETWA